MRIKWFAFVILLAAAVYPLSAQMGDPANGPMKIANEDLDPARNISDLSLESSTHTPLPEQYIWTSEDAVPEHPMQQAGWKRYTDEGDALHSFRRSFVLEAAPPHATLYVAGFSAATIYLNGHLVGEDELDPDAPIGLRVFTHDVAGLLKPGKNVLAIQATCGPTIGNSSNSRLGIQIGRGEGLVVKILSAEKDIERPAILLSDRQWKATMHAGADWYSPSLDDSSWPKAESLGGIESAMEFFQWNGDAGLYNWPGYDGISPFLAQYPLAAAKISHIYKGAGVFHHLDALTKSEAAEFAVDLSSSASAAEDTPHLLLDFGREVAGRIQLQSDSDQAAEVTVQYGESEGEALNEPYLGVTPIYIPPHGSVYGPKSAFRYALIRFTSGTKTAFRSVRVMGITYPVAYKGSFVSSDPQLNQMWTIGAYTARLCMQDDIWDAPKRDRGPWMGDLNVSGRTIEDVFGPTSLMDDSLDHLLGEEPVRYDVNGIPGYSAFWVITEADYFRHTGSVQQLQTVHARLVQLLHYMEGELNGAGLFVSNRHIWPFVDWSPELSSDTPESRRGTQFEYYAAFRDGAWLLQQLHDDANAELFAKRAAAIKAAAQRSMLSSSGSFGMRWQTNAYAVLSGVANSSQYPAIWQHALSSVGHVQYNAFIITPYYNYYVISAMAKMGHRAEALNWIRQYWGGMTQEGATSFWEGYDPAWYKGSDFHLSLQADDMSGYHVSLAHGWSSGVTPWLMEEILGIRITGPGFSTVEIRPDLIGLQWAKGAEPTPRGLLRVSINQQGTTIDLPPGTIARVSVPITSKIAKVFINGKNTKFTPAEDDRRAILMLSREGHFDIESR